MTAMQQIEAISIMARAEGLTYGQYIKKYPNCMEKPKSRIPEKTVSIVKHRKVKTEDHKVHITHLLACKNCGGEFVAKRKDAKYCDYCKREIARAQSRKRMEEKRKAAREAKEARVDYISPYENGNDFDLPPMGGFHDY